MGGDFAATRKYLRTVLRSIPSSRAVRLRDQPSASDCFIVFCSRFSAGVKGCVFRLPPAAAKSWTDEGLMESTRKLLFSYQRVAQLIQEVSASFKCIAPTQVREVPCCRSVSGL